MKRKILIFFLVLLMLAGPALSAGTAQSGDETPGTVTRFSDLENKRIGVATGSVQVLQVEDRFPNAEICYYTTDVDMLEALRANKVDAFASAELSVRYMAGQNPDLTYLKEWLSDGMQAGAVFPKTDTGRALCDEFSAYIREIRQNGVYQEIEAVWFGGDEERQVVSDLYNLPAVNGTLRMAVDTSLVPVAFIRDGKPVGLDIDVAVHFCKARGYSLELVQMDFSGIIPSVVTGKVDFGCSGIAYTAERAESVLFSDPFYESHSVIAILKNTVPAEAGFSFLDSLAGSFHKTFIREGRWKLFLEGVWNTLLITVLSVFFGTCLGFGTFLLCRSGNSFANAVAGFCIWLVQGMPMVVLLMILYYIIFGSTAVSGILVAVIGFSLTFGAAVFGLLKIGVGAVDSGQYEGACALGYSSRRTFFRIILPQALPHVLPAWQGEISGLIKATSIVGYIAVQDLTKMGDIVRSRTYEAFFPLIIISIIYFVLEWLFSLLVSRIRIRFDFKKRSREKILRGINLPDQQP